MTKNQSTAKCFCGRMLSLGERAAPGVELEVGCVCGRRLAFEGGDSSWVYRGSVVREGSVPVIGFSKELRQRPDTERYWFEVTEPGQHRVAVHIVFSPSQKTAEVKPLDARPLLLVGVSSPTQARRKWLEWRNAGGKANPPRRNSEGAAPLG